MKKQAVFGGISIRWKLATTVILSCIALLIMATHASYVSNQSNKILKELTHKNYPILSASENILSLYEQIPSIFETAITSSDEGVLNKADELNLKILNLFSDIKSKRLPKDLESKLEQAKTSYVAYFEFSRKFAQGFIDSSLDFSKASEMGVENRANIETAQKDISKLQYEAAQVFNGSVSHVKESVKGLASSIWIVAIFISLIVGSLSILINRKITNGLKTVIKGMNSVSSENGDLSIRLTRPSNDELGDLADAYNAVIQKVDINIGKLLSNMDGLANIVKEIEASSKDAKMSNDTQVSVSLSLGQAVEDLKLSVSSIAKNASIAAESAEDADNEVSRGVAVVSQTRSSIEALSTSIEEAAMVVSDMKKVSNDVNSILSVIQTIAEQTNLLALNAAIEAARAGEHGRGFAVVADEVRSLASKTQKSTEEIRSLLERLNSTSDSAVVAINEGGERAGETVSAANEAADALDMIRKQVQSISDQNTEIATATEEQNQVAENTSGRIKEMDEETRVSQENITKLGGITNELSTIFNQLEKIVKAFKKP